MNGLRYGSTRMLGIRRSRSVTAATSVSATNGSRASWPPALSHLCDGAGWSVKPNPSKPAASAAWAKRVIPSLLTNSGLKGWARSGYVIQCFTEVTLVSEVVGDLPNDGAALDE